MFSVEEKIDPIPAEVLAQISDFVGQIKALAAPYMHSLTLAQRKKVPKMGDDTVAFVQKALEYAGSNPQFAPAYLDVKGLAQNTQTVDDLTPIHNPLASLAMQFDDTIMIAGSEAYIAALTYYNSVKEAARRNVPGAKAIYEDLKKRFDFEHHTDKPESK